MTTIPVEPFYDKLFAHYTDLQIDISFWDWVQKEYGAYQVFIKSNPTSVGEKEACGLLFSDAEEATLFALRWH
jgi:hypothetical protein